MRLRLLPVVALLGASTIVSSAALRQVSGRAPTPLVDDRRGPPYDAATAARLCASDAATANALGWSVETLRAARRARGSSNLGLLESTPKQLEKALSKIGRPKEAGSPLGALWYAIGLEDESGAVPDDGWARGKAQRDALIESERILGTASWTPLGPGNIGGRIRAIAPHPTDANTIFVGSVSGGIWKTTNAGASWSVIDDFMASLAVTQIVFDPNDANVMFASTGEGSIAGSNNELISHGHLVRGAGVFKSTNGGTTWFQLASTANTNFLWTNRIAISPSGATLLAATETGVWRSTNGGGFWTQETTAPACDVDFDPTNSLRAVAGDRVDGAVRWTIDGGDTWTATTFPNPTDRVETCWSKTVPGVVYASLDLDGANGNGVVAELWRSTNGGQSFSVRNNTTDFLGGQGFYDNIVWVSPYTAAGAVPATANDEVVICGGVWLWRATDGGTTLTQISNTTPPHADNHMIMESIGFNGVANRLVYFSSDGGISSAADVFTAGTPVLSAGWTELNNTLHVTQYYAGAGHAGTETLIGGTQDNGTSKFTPGGGPEAWDKILGADGAFCSIDPANVNNMFASTQFLSLFRSTNAGVSFTQIDGTDWPSPPKPATQVLTDSVGPNPATNFIACSRLDPNNVNNLWGGGTSLWRTTDSQTAVAAATGPTWTAVKGPTAGGSRIYFIEVMQGNGNVVWVSHSNGDLYSSANALAVAPTWTQRDNGVNPLPNRALTSIKIDPNNSSRVYVTFGGFSANNVWVTTNGGVNWAALPGLPSIPMRAIEIDPVDPQTLYAGTELGVVYSVDGGQHWKAPNSGPANVPVMDLIFLNDTLYAATYGRGWFKQTPAVDIVPPAVTATVGTKVLWPALRGLNDVKLKVLVSDAGDPSPTRRVAVFSDETNGAAPYTPDAAVSTTPPFPPGQTFSLRCRSERATAGNGRLYVVSTSATDANNNVGRDACALVCPKSMTTGHLTALLLEASAAEASADASATGTPSAPWNNGILGTTVLPAP